MIFYCDLFQMKKINESIEFLLEIYIFFYKFSFLRIKTYFLFQFLSSFINWLLIWSEKCKLSYQSLGNLLKKVELLSNELIDFRLIAVFCPKFYSFYYNVRKIWSQLWKNLKLLKISPYSCTAELMKHFIFKFSTQKIKIYCQNMSSKHLIMSPLTWECLWIKYKWWLKNHKKACKYWMNSSFDSKISVQTQQLSKWIIT